MKRRKVKFGDKIRVKKVRIEGGLPSKDHEILSRIQTVSEVMDIDVTGEDNMQAIWVEGFPYLIEPEDIQIM